jgi:cytochrome c oxidase subunit 2
MVDSTMVLNGQTIAYTLYCVVIILLVTWFGFKVTRPAKTGIVKNWFFYSFVGMLTVLGVSLHIVTSHTIPWVPVDLHRSDYVPDKTFKITVGDHAFTLPSEELVIDCNDLVLFDVTSEDLTYGFGVFRQDNSMVFQMQVVPGHKNDVLWRFDKPGVYSIRSTEYSGPRGVFMIEKDAIKVRECEGSEES